MPSDSSTAWRRAGIVRAIDGGVATIAVEKEGCSACGKASGCAVGRLAAAAGETRIRLPVGREVEVGATLAIEVDVPSLLRDALRGYLLPAVTLLFGAGLGESLAADPGAAAGALAGLVLGIVATRRGGRRSGAGLRIAGD